MSKKDLLARITQLEAENLELRARAGELPQMPCNSEGLPFSGPRLIVARNRRGLSLNEFAKMLGVNKRTLIDFESETAAPTEGQIDSMSLLLHFPRNWFFAKDFRLVNPERISWRNGPWVWNIDNIHERKWIDD